MDEGQLRAFLTIGELHSITKAADELGLAQPSLSQQLLRLEDELGTKLFDRTSRGVSMTAAGQVFRTHAEAILLSTRLAREEVRRSATGLIGEVSIGMPISLGELIAPDIVRAVQQELPGVKLRLRLAFASDLTRWIEKGTLNAGLIYYSDDLSYLQAVHIADEMLFIIGPPDAFGSVDDRGIALEPVHAESLRHLDLLLPPMSKGLKRRINQQPHGEAIRLSVRSEIDSLPILKALLLDGAGYSLLPHLAVREELRSGQLSAARISDMDVNLPFALVRAGSRPPAALQAVETIVLKKLEELRQNGEWLVDRPSLYTGQTSTSCRNSRVTASRSPSLATAAT